MNSEIPRFSVFVAGWHGGSDGRGRQKAYDGDAGTVHGLELTASFDGFCVFLNDLHVVTWTVQNKQVTYHSRAHGNLLFCENILQTKTTKMVRLYNNIRYDVQCANSAGQ